MRFMIMHKLTPELERGVPPTPETIDRIDALMGEAMEAGVMLGGEGLRQSSTRLMVDYRGGKRAVTRGPLYPNTDELLGGFSHLTVRTEEEALSWLDRMAAVLGDGEICLGPCTEAWHLGMGDKPEDAPLRYLALTPLTARAEQGLPPEAEQAAKMADLFAEMSEAGVLQAHERLSRTREGARIHLDGDQLSVIDGPFAESKELISGYGLFELPSLEAAIEWGSRWIKCVGVHEVEVRVVAD